MSAAQRRQIYKRRALAERRVATARSQLPRASSATASKAAASQCLQIITVICFTEYRRPRRLPFMCVMYSACGPKKQLRPSAGGGPARVRREQ